MTLLPSCWATCNQSLTTSAMNIDKLLVLSFGNTSKRMIRRQINESVLQNVFYMKNKTSSCPSSVLWFSKFNLLHTKEWHNTVITSFCRHQEMFCLFVTTVNHAARLLLSILQLNCNVLKVQLSTRLCQTDKTYRFDLYGAKCVYMVLICQGKLINLIP